MALFDYLLFKTVIRKPLESVGFKVEKYVGMWGKREVVRVVCV